MKQGPPTKRQAAVLAFIAEYTESRGYAPTLAEIGAAIEVRAISTVWKHLFNLQDKGLITRQWNQNRSMTLLHHCPTCGRATIPAL